MTTPSYTTPWDTINETGRFSTTRGLEQAGNCIGTGFIVAQREQR